MNDESLGIIAECYMSYCSVIKPLIAQIEARSEKIPLQLFNEIRAFNDHIARCFYNSPSESYIRQQTDKAQRHITRLALDCFKCLNVILFQQIDLFDRQTRNIDLTVIDNGQFYPVYSHKRIQAAKLVENAKMKEHIDIVESLNLYQEAFNLYDALVNDINGISEKVKWARVRFRVRKTAAIIGWVISVIASAIISAVFSCELVSRFL